MIIYITSTWKKSFYNSNITLNYCFICKIISGVTLHGNAPGNSKCPYFNTIILPTLEKVEKFQTAKIHVFFRNIDPHNSRLNRKRVVIHKKHTKNTHIWRKWRTPQNSFWHLLMNFENPKNHNLEKKKKNCWGYNHFTHVHRKLQSYEVRFLRCRVRETNFFAIMGNFLSFYPTNNPKNQNFQKLKKNNNNKKKHLDISSFNTSETKNDDHMLYCSWDMAHDRCHFYFSFWTFFSPFTH